MLQKHNFLMTIEKAEKTRFLPSLQKCIYLSHCRTHNTILSFLASYNVQLHLRGVQKDKISAWGFWTQEVWENVTQKNILFSVPEPLLESY